jgi:hypothetical protein
MFLIIILFFIFLLINCHGSNWIHQSSMKMEGKTKLKMKFQKQLDPLEKEACE